MARKCYYTIDRKDSTSIPPQLWILMDKLSDKYSLPKVDIIDIHIYPDTFFLIEAESCGEVCVGAMLPIFVYMLSDRDLETFLEFQFQSVHENEANPKNVIAKKYSDLADQWNSFLSTDEFLKTIASAPDDTLNTFELKVFPNEAERNRLFNYNNPEIRSQICVLFETYCQLLSKDVA